MSLQSGTACLFIGGQSLLVLCAERALEKGYKLRGIVSDDPAARRWADEYAVSCIEPGDGLATRIGSEAFDYLFSVGHLARIPGEILALPRRAAINFHDGPLPDYAGLNVTSWALLNREKEHGITWHLMTERLDKGDILRQARFPISDGETAFTLNAKCLEAGFACFDELLDDIRTDALAPVAQDLARQKFYGKYRRLPGAGTVDWTNSAEEIAALARALDFGGYANPITTPKSWIGPAPFTFDSIELLPMASGRPAGTVVRFAGDAITVATGTNDVSVSGLATLDGRPLDCSDLAARFGLCEGDRLRSLSDAEESAIGEADAAVCRHEEFWTPRLRELEPVEIPYARRPAGEEPCLQERLEVADFGPVAADAPSFFFDGRAGALSGPDRRQGAVRHRLRKRWAGDGDRWSGKPVRESRSSLDQPG